MADAMDVDDPQLAAAIAASYQTSAGVSEDDLIAQAMELSRKEEEARQQGGPSPPSSAPAPAAAPVPDVAAGDFDRLVGPQDFPQDAEDPMLAAALQASLADHGRAGAAPRRESPPRQQVPGLTGSELAGALGGQGGGEDTMDPQLAAALEASYRAQTSAGLQDNEDDMIAQAIQMSKREEDARQRQALREAQEMELQESMLMDKMREEEDERKKREEVERKLQEEQQRQLAEAQAAVDLQKAAAEKDAIRARIPPEPAAGEPDRVDLMIRTPDGQRIRRAFRGTDLVGHIYDFLDSNGGEAFETLHYRLVTNMPRKAYEDRSQSLTAAEMKGQVALMVEVVQQ
eukprot:TRINITY_DN16772_c0_g2_i1.p1 TRINITY_DN16772_c0_g2~~TRINITY_DN16772_c0_g2_i1.p1  ORF type:complete len:379 (+),score=95.22 TRINITY_DN16772_c0_g2_i1:108-1139(+)